MSPRRKQPESKKKRAKPTQAVKVDMPHRDTPPHKESRPFSIVGDTCRPITDIASDLIYPEITDDVHEVLQTPVFIEKPIANRDGRWVTARIMPYRTFEMMLPIEGKAQHSEYTA